MWISRLRSLQAYRLRGGRAFGHRHVGSLMQLKSVKAIYRKRRTSIPDKGRKINLYVLGNVAIQRLNQVWTADITCCFFAILTVDHLRHLLQWIAHWVIGRKCHEVTFRLHSQLLPCANPDNVWVLPLNRAAPLPLGLPALRCLKNESAKKQP